MAKIADTEIVTPNHVTEITVTPAELDLLIEGMNMMLVLDPGVLGQDVRQLHEDLTSIKEDLEW